MREFGAIDAPLEAACPIQLCFADQKVCFLAESGRTQRDSALRKCADFVAEVVEERSEIRGGGI
jgi:hypothetical protein